VNLYVEALVAGAKFTTALRLRFSLVTLAAIARDVAHGGDRDGVAWLGVVRQIRDYAAKLRRAAAGAKTGSAT
jgi:hypothetical protein